MKYLTQKPGIARTVAETGEPSGADSGVEIACVVITRLRAKMEMRRQFLQNHPQGEGSARNSHMGAQLRRWDPAGGLWNGGGR